eukprot:5425555-Alexandrium_andersonii.AAC.1
METMGKLRQTISEVQAMPTEVKKTSAGELAIVEARRKACQLVMSSSEPELLAYIKSFEAGGQAHSATEPNTPDATDSTTRASGTLTKMPPCG